MPEKIPKEHLKEESCDYPLSDAINDAISRSGTRLRSYNMKEDLHLRMYWYGYQSALFAVSCYILGYDKPLKELK